MRTLTLIFIVSSLSPPLPQLCEFLAYRSSSNNAVRNRLEVVRKLAAFFIPLQLQSPIHYCHQIVAPLLLDSPGHRCSEAVGFCDPLSSFQNHKRCGYDIIINVAAQRIINLLHALDAAVSHEV